MRRKIIYLTRALLFMLTRFPMHKVRLFAFRQLGFSIGDEVYLAQRINMTVGIADDSISLKIGNRAAIGPNSTFILATHPCYSKLHKILTYPPRRIIIGDDTWVGANVIIMPGITIGKCCIIGAGAVVTHDIPDFSVAVGSPARVIKMLDSEQLK